MQQNNRNHLSKYAITLLAGGDATRFSSNLPKGCYPFDKEKKVTLFSLFFLSLLKTSEHTLIFIVVSPSNSEPTISYLHTNNFFGYNSSLVHFLVQDELALLCEKSKEPIIVNNEIVHSPAGNGSFLKKYFPFHELIEDIDHMAIGSIDNPSFFPFRLDALNHTISSNSDCTIVAFEKSNTSTSKVGSLFTKNNKPFIVDYTENIVPSSEDMRLGNTGHYILSKDALARLGEVELPIHHIIKTYNVNSIEKKCIKQEYFITDACNSIENRGVYIIKEPFTFLPIKTKDDMRTYYEINKTKL